MPGETGYNIRTPWLVDDDYFHSGFAYTRLQEQDWTELYLSVGNSYLTGDSRAHGLALLRLGAAAHRSSVGHRAGLSRASTGTPTARARSFAVDAKARRLLGSPRLAAALRHLPVRRARTRWAARCASRPACATGRSGSCRASARTSRRSIRTKGSPSSTTCTPARAGARTSRSASTSSTRSTHDKRQLKEINDADMRVYGLDARADARSGSARSSTSAARRSKRRRRPTSRPRIEVMHAYGGRGLTENYLGTQKSNNGTGTLWNAALGLHVLDAQPCCSAWSPRGAASSGAATSRSASSASSPTCARTRAIPIRRSTATSARCSSGASKAAGPPLSWLALSLRYDRVILDVKDDANSFRIISPRITLAHALARRRRDLPAVVVLLLRRARAAPSGAGGARNPARLERVQDPGAARVLIYHPSCNKLALRDEPGRFHAAISSASWSPTATSSVTCSAPAGCAPSIAAKICAAVRSRDQGAPADKANVKEFAARFQREVTTAKRIDHPNVAAISDSGELPGGGLFLVMELLKGTLLSNALENGRMPPARALVIARQMLVGLGRAHELGVVHRDVKPHNVMLIDVGGLETVKLFDFGIASNDRAAMKLTVPGTAFGTPEYIAPEQAMGEKVDARADLYGVGVVLFEMLCGRLPFVCKDDIAYLRAHIKEPAPAAVERRARRAHLARRRRAGAARARQGSREALRRRQRDDRRHRRRRRPPPARGARLARSWGSRWCWRFWPSRSSSARAARRAAARLVALLSPTRGNVTRARTSRVLKVRRAADAPAFRRARCRRRPCRRLRPDRALSG